MRIRSAQTEEELVADRLADYSGACTDETLYASRIRLRRRVREQPLRAATAGAFAFDVIHVLDRGSESRERTRTRSRQRPRQIMRNERASLHGTNLAARATTDFGAP